jgi:hypothetical protein
MIAFFKLNIYKRCFYRVLVLAMIACYLPANVERRRFLKAEKDIIIEK